MSAPLQARLPEPIHQQGKEVAWFPWRPLLAIVCLALLTGCSQEQVMTAPLYTVLLDPEAAHECLHEDRGICWAHLHWSNAQHFCKIALEAEAPKPLRWEKQPLSGDLAALVDAVPETELVLQGKGTPAFNEAAWHDWDQKQIFFRGAYDLQSRTGINEWTPWAYSCTYDTFRYEVLAVEVEPVPN